ncbi:MAG: glutamate--cysteine ligase [Halodesulfurarchaeum sp.]
MSDGSRAHFTELGTVGVEEEYFVVDDDGMPVAGTDELVYEGDPPAPLEDRLDHELFKFVIEARTPTLPGPDAAPDAVRDMRETLVTYAREHGYQIAAAGLHPEADWRLHEHAEKPRYRSQLERIQYPQHRNTTAGLHLHVGVDHPDKAVWIANELRWYLPIFLALSANSPFWNGFDTGLASARAKIFENLPNTGMPTAFEDYAAFEDYESVMLETGSIEDRGELWFDVRPHSGLGTVEIRVPDAQDRTVHVDAFVEYAHALVIDLAARFEDGEEGQPIRRELLDENKWRALRTGHSCELIDRDGDGVVSLETVVERECTRLGIDGLRAVLDAESGAARQRRVLEGSGSSALRSALLVEPRV